MTSRTLHAALLGAAFIAGTTLAYAQSGSTAGAGGSTAGSSAGAASTTNTGGSNTGGSNAGKGMSNSTMGTSGSAAGSMSNSGPGKKTGLDRADDVAGRHGQQGRDNAREQQK